MLALYMEKMNGLSPINKLNKGFAYVSDEEGKALLTTDQVSPDDQVTIKVMDGDITAKVTGVDKRRRS